MRDLLQIRSYQPDRLAIGLPAPARAGAIGMPAEHPGRLERQVAGGFLAGLCTVGR